MTPRTETQKAYALANREQINARQREYYAKNRDHLREAIKGHRLRRVYGLTPQEVTEILTKQEGLCAICAQGTRYGY